MFLTYIGQNLVNGPWQWLTLFRPSGHYPPSGGDIIGALRALVPHCSPTNREHELGLHHRETG